MKFQCGTFATDWLSQLYWLILSRYTPQTYATKIWYKNTLITTNLGRNLSPSSAPVRPVMCLVIPLKTALRGQNIAKTSRAGGEMSRANWRNIDTGAAAKKPPPPVVFLQAAVSHIYATKSQPSVIFESDSVSHIFNDWWRLRFYNVIMY